MQPRKRPQAIATSDLEKAAGASGRLIVFSSLQHNHLIILILGGTQQVDLHKQLHQKETELLEMLERWKNTLELASGQNLKLSGVVNGDGNGSFITIIVESRDGKASVVCGNASLLEIRFVLELKELTKEQRDLVRSFLDTMNSARTRRHLCKAGHDLECVGQLNTMLRKKNIKIGIHADPKRDRMQGFNYWEQELCFRRVQY